MKLSTGGENKNFLNASNCKSGDIITVLDSGVKEPSKKFNYPNGNPKIQYNFKVKMSGKDYTLSMNKFSRDEMIKVYGEDTEGWIGKNAKITIEPVRSLGTNMIILQPTDEVSDVQEEEKNWEES